MPRGFTWVDHERLIRFGDDALAEAPELLRSRGFDRFTAFTTDRWVERAAELGAAEVVRVPPGRVDDISAELVDRTEAKPLVALGGGRVVDTAKAIAAAQDVPVAALPTTLSGAEMTGFHRVPPGVQRMVRPSLVIAVPQLMASQPEPGVYASAMNALAHAVEALYVPLANPVTDMAALRAAQLLASDDPESLSLGAILAGYASGATGIAVHHVLGQTIVRTTGAPHAQTYAALLPHTVKLMVRRADEPLSRLAEALGDTSADPDAAPGLVRELASRAQVDGLRSLGMERSHISPVLDEAMRRPQFQDTPSPPTRKELEVLLETAL
ncbi:MAG: iron-containing alcohol dehydrogenase [Thermoleophilaceae bacterium]